MSKLANWIVFGPFTVVGLILLCQLLQDRPALISTLGFLYGAGTMAYFFGQVMRGYANAPLTRRPDKVSIWTLYILAAGTIAVAAYLLWDASHFYRNARLLPHFRAAALFIPAWLIGVSIVALPYIRRLSRS
jgi:hypothetical protein